MKIAALLKYLMNPLTLHALEDDGAASTPEDRGDFVTDDAAAAAAAGAEALTEEEQAAADAKEAEDAAAVEAEAAAAAAAAAEKEGKGAAADDKDDKDDRRKDTRIPLSRHKEILDRERAQRESMAAEIERLKQGQRASETAATIDETESKLVTMEGEYNKLLADGEIAKATAKMTEIRRLERTIGEQRSDERAQAAENRAYARVQYDAIVSNIESAYPVLNQDSDQFDQAKVDEVMELQALYRTGGNLMPAAALQKAVKLIMGTPTTTAEQKAIESTPEPTAAATAAAARKAATLARNIAAAQGTPASTAKVGLNNDEKGGVLTGAMAMKMGQDDFAKLSEKELAKIRGDDF